MGWMVLVVFALLIIMAIGHAIATLSTLLCILFALCFWVGLVLFIIQAPKIISDKSRGSFKERVQALTEDWGAILLLFAFIIFIIAVFVDFIGLITFAPTPNIEFSHLFFPWQRFML